VPLLKRGPEIFPQALFDLSEDESPWFVAHTRSRQEKALARYLMPLEIPFYLPSSENRVRRGGRNFVSYLPLFPGYVFLRGSAAERGAAVRSNMIVRLLDVPDQGLLHGELRDLRRLQLSGATLVPAPALFPGDAVRVTDGAFRGYTGTVLSEHGRLRLIVSISMLRQSVAVEFDRGNLALEARSSSRVVGSAAVA
jgi:transcription antitermination factor NusG